MAEVERELEKVVEQANIIFSLITGTDSEYYIHRLSQLSPCAGSKLLFAIAVVESTSFSVLHETIPGEISVLCDAENLSLLAILSRYQHSDQ